MYECMLRSAASLRMRGAARQHSSVRPQGCRSRWWCVWPASGWRRSLRRSAFQRDRFEHCTSESSVLDQPEPAARAGAPLAPSPRPAAPTDHVTGGSPADITASAANDVLRGVAPPPSAQMGGTAAHHHQHESARTIRPALLAMLRLLSAAPRACRLPCWSGHPHAPSTALPRRLASPRAISSGSRWASAVAAPGTSPPPPPAETQPLPPTGSEPAASGRKPGLLELFFPRAAPRAEQEAQAELIASLREAYTPPSNDPKRTFIGYHGDRPDAHAWAVPGQTLPPGWQPVLRATPGRVLAQWKALSKSRLTFLMMLTGMAGYALVPASLSVGASVATLLSLTAGMGLCSCAANALNQFLEAPYDAQMVRTRNRPLPARQTTHLSAAVFAGVTATAGVGMLAALVNPTVAALGAGNIVLYSFVYTPLKRLHIVNTWVGSIVGAIPPLMGWAAATNGALLGAADLPAWVLAFVLFAWQFPHFNALSHTLCSDYARGAYRMMSVLSPGLNRRTAMRYALLLVPACLALPFIGGVSAGAGVDASSAATGAGASAAAVVPAFALLSLVPNLALCRSTWRFYRFGDTKSARHCFLTSLWHLPAVMLLAMFCKSDLWAGWLAHWPSWRHTRIATSEAVLRDQPGPQTAVQNQIQSQNQNQNQI